MAEDGTPETTAAGSESTAEKERKPRAVRTARKEKELKGTDALANFNGDKQYYTIGEVAVLFNVRTSNIRFWTKEFDLKVRTTRKGDRLYTPEQVREINTIYHLVKERGFTIAGARAKLKDNKKAAVNAVDLKKSLTQLRSKLLQIRNKLS
ncbi:MAG: MerR family transcriptional regulator [Bacteroidetes bacterium]|nr:MerR family transcriptional regulator [Bacteroidota bacterium]